MQPQTSGKIQKLENTVTSSSQHVYQDFLNKFNDSGDKNWLWALYKRDSRENDEEQALYYHSDQDKKLISCFDTEQEALLYCVYKIYKNSSSNNEKAFEFRNLLNLSNQELRHIIENQNLVKIQQTSKENVKIFFVEPCKKITKEKLFLKFQKPQHFCQTSTSSDSKAQKAPPEKQILKEKPRNLNIITQNSKSSIFSQQKKRKREEFTLRNDQNEKESDEESELEISRSKRKRIRKDEEICDNELEMYDLQSKFCSPDEKNLHLFEENCKFSTVDQILDKIFEIEFNYYEGNEIPRTIDRDFAQARKIFEFLSKIPHFPSQYYLGCLISWGLGGEKNDKMGKMICESSAQQAFQFFAQRSQNLDKIPNSHPKNENFRYIYAKMLETGQGTPKSFQKAFHEYEKAAQNGSARSLWTLGKIFEHGNEIEQIQKNIEKACFYFRKASELGLSFQPTISQVPNSKNSFFDSFPPQNSFNFSSSPDFYFDFPKNNNYSFFDDINQISTKRDQLSSRTRIIDHRNTTSYDEGEEVWLWD